jgi:hypothetical protein
MAGGIEISYIIHARTQIAMGGARSEGCNSPGYII